MGFGNSRIDEGPIIDARIFYVNKALKASKSVCKIFYQKNNKKFSVTGFFMIINKDLKCLISNYYIINEDLINKSINIKLYDKTQISIKLKNRFYKFYQYLYITIIEVKDSDFDKEISFLDYDPNYLRGYNNYVDKDLYTIQYPRENIEIVSGKIIEILYDKKNNFYEFEHNMDPDYDSSGSPIIIMNTSDVIGIHKYYDCYKKINIGTFIGEILKDRELNSNIKRIIQNNDNNTNNIDKNINNKYEKKQIKDNFNNNNNFNNSNNNNINNNKEYNLKNYNYNNDEDNNEKDFNNDNSSNEKLLEEFNIKYNLKLNKNEEEILLHTNLNYWIGDEGLKYLCEIEFKHLKVLNLSSNHLTDIKVLKHAKYINLERLDLSYNEISDIDILEKVNFKELERLDLANNKIIDINVLEKVNFKKLKELDLSSNKISDITPLNKADFKKLNVLKLYGNNLPEYLNLNKSLYKILKNNNNIFPNDLEYSNPQF